MSDELIKSVEMISLDEETYKVKVTLTEGKPFTFTTILDQGAGFLSRGLVFVEEVESGLPWPAGIPKWRSGYRLPVSGDVAAIYSPLIAAIIMEIYRGDVEGPDLRYPGNLVTIESVLESADRLKNLCEEAERWGEGRFDVPLLALLKTRGL